MNFGCYWPHSQLQELPLIGLNQSLYIYNPRSGLMTQVRPIRVKSEPYFENHEQLFPCDWMVWCTANVEESSLRFRSTCGGQSCENHYWKLNPTMPKPNKCLDSEVRWTNKFSLFKQLFLFVFVITCNQGIITEILSPVKLGLTSFLFLAIPCC